MAGRWEPCRGLRTDVRLRLSFYGSDWRDAASAKLMVLAASTYVFCASAIPALAFGEQLHSETDGALSAVQVLAATAVTGLAQALAGGQPLLIVGVAEPIVLMYGFMFRFARDKDGLGPDLFLAWCAWACLWAAILICLLALGNACSYISRFTRFAGELFGGLIALLFMQQAIKGCVEEFRAVPEAGDAGASTASPTWQLVNGLWSLLLAWGLLLTSLLLRRARSWRFLRAPLRGFLADYCAPLMLVAFTGLSFAVHGPAGSGVPRRLHSPNTWAVKDSWTVAGDMSKVGGRWIAAALVPAALIALLFFFDHNVSSQLAQQAEYNLKKPPAYHYDFFLLSLMTLLCGLLGLPPVNGVLPQSPMHTKALARIAGKRSSTAAAKERSQQQWEGQRAEGQREATPEQPDAAPAEAAGPVPAAALGTSAPAFGAPPGGVRPSRLSVQLAMSKAVHASPSKQALLAPVAGSTSSADFAAAGPGSIEPSTPSVAGAAAADERGMDAGVKEDGAAAGDEDEVVAVAVVEQRVSGLLQSLAVGVCLAAMPAIRQIPTAVLWGFFAFMALESLPGSQLWERTLLLLTDPRRRARLLEKGHAPYLETVPFRTIAWFTLFQLALLLGVYGLTWAGIAGIAFPVPIMLLVPLRHWVMPRLFRCKRHLQELDAAAEEEAAPLGHRQAVQEAVEQGLAAAPGRQEHGTAAGHGCSHDAAEQGGAGSICAADDEGAAELNSELRGYRIVHHLSRRSLLQRRQHSLRQDEGAAAEAAAGEAAAVAVAGQLGHSGSPRTGARMRRHSHELPQV